MSKITLELIATAIQRTNPLKDRELDLKGNKISLIENLGTTLDQFDTIDFSDNEIHRFDGFPLLKRLKAINFTNNKVMKVASGLEQFIPNIDTLIFINNYIKELREVDNLTGFKRLEFLVMMKNPVSLHHQYRLYVIQKLPQVRILDFVRVKDSERQQAALMFGAGSKHSASLAIMERPKIVNGGSKVKVDLDDDEGHVASQEQESMEGVTGHDHSYRKPTVADMQALKTALQNATSMDEIDRLNYLLSSGQFVGFASTRRV